MNRTPSNITTIEHAGLLDDLTEIPAYLTQGHEKGVPHTGHYSCSFCGVGDSGTLLPKMEKIIGDDDSRSGKGIIQIIRDGEIIEYPVSIDGYEMTVETTSPLTKPGGVISGEVVMDGTSRHITARETGRRTEDDWRLVSQRFVFYKPSASATDSVIKNTIPTTGCVKLKLSMMRQRPVFPIQIAPSVLSNGERQTVDYHSGILRFADLLLGHLKSGTKTLIYACGQIDYFSVFAMQEVFRLLGVRNLTGNAEHCLNAGAVHNEILTGQEGPFLTVDQAVNGSNRLFIFNGWNGFITHPPVFNTITSKKDCDAYLIEVMVSESAKVLAKKLGPERIILIRPGSDPHFALGIAYEILHHHADAIEQRFIDQYTEPDSFADFNVLARLSQFAAEAVAERIAPETQYRERIINAIKDIAAKLVKKSVVPINIPSVGLSQSSGIVTHCLWGDLFAMLGKYGLNADSSPAGGTLRIPGQINAESEVQGLSRKYFMGRLPMTERKDAAMRMGLPEDAYDRVTEDEPRAALDYSDPTPGTKELFISFGTQFEANMMNRPRWLRKLTDPDVSLIVVDPLPDPFSLEHADLIIPSPPHSAATKVYQNGEWKLSLSLPQKKAAVETRSDPTIIYDVMAEICQRIEQNPAVAADHPYLAKLAESGYLKSRFTNAGLTRIEGEVSRPQLWQRILDYMRGGCGPLYCAPEHSNGDPITWSELLDKGGIIYGGVGETRYRMDYNDPSHQPFADIFRRPRKFKFFSPNEEDLQFYEGIVLNSGRSGLMDDRARIRFASSSFNSGKSTPATDMPDENPIHVPEALAAKLGLKDGEFARITGRHNGEQIILPVVVSNRVKGESLYVSFHKSRGQLEKGHYINDVITHELRCPYCAQTKLKCTPVLLERLSAPGLETRPAAATVLLHNTAEKVALRTLPLDATLIDSKAEMPLWQGQSTALFVTDIIKETEDVFTFRFQGNPLCRFVYWPGQFCTIVLNINGKKVLRSYTISSTPSRPYVLEVTVKRVPGGLVSNWLPDNLKVGDPISIAGPKGKFCLAPGKIHKKILFLTGGSGITPLMAMSRWLCDVSADVDMKFLNSVRSPKDIIFHKELELLTSRYKMFEPVVITASREKTDAWLGPTGHIDAHIIKKVAPDFIQRHVYMCGPQPFMDAMKAILISIGFPMDQLHSESFGGVRTATDKLAVVAPGAAVQLLSATADKKPATAKNAFTVEFSRSGKTGEGDEQSCLLDVAEDLDVDIDYSCRSGSCGACKVKLLSGEVEMETTDGLEESEQAEGYVLACVSMLKKDCKVDV